MLLAVILPVTVALVTSKEALTALVKPLLTLAVNCLPVPAALTVSPENDTVPLPAAVPISIEVVPWSEPPPALTAMVTILLAPIPTMESFPNGSRLLSAGCGLSAEP